jgi:putative DNA primase/helicase
MATVHENAAGGNGHGEHTTAGGLAAPDPEAQERLRKLAATLDGATPCLDGSGFMAFCPVCGSDEPSLHLGIDEDGCLWVTCLAGCAEWRVRDCLSLYHDDAEPEEEYDDFGPSDREADEFFALADAWEQACEEQARAAEDVFDDYEPSDGDGQEEDQGEHWQPQFADQEAEDQEVEAEGTAGGWDGDQGGPQEAPEDQGPAPEDPSPGGATDRDGSAGPVPATARLQALARCFSGCVPCSRGGRLARCPCCRADAPTVHLSVLPSGHLRVSCAVGCMTATILGRLGLDEAVLRPDWRPAADTSDPGDSKDPADTSGSKDPGATGDSGGAGRAGAGGGAGGVQPAECVDNPHRLARIAVRERWTHADGPTLVFWREQFHHWDGAAYRPVPPKELAALLSRVAKEEMDRQNLSGNMAVAPEVTARLVSDVTQALSSYTLLPGTTEAPAWLDAKGPFPAEEVLACRNGLVHLPSFVCGRDYSHQATPMFFSPTALDFDFDPNAPPPAAWLEFLGQLWPHDEQSIETLQMWFGYCLLPDTSQQKILLMIGPRRSGKGTIARVLRGLVGEANVAGPTLASLSSHFGLWPLVNKTLAVISDARLSGRTDATVVTERLLSISGEDVQTVDRKYLTPVTTKLLTRFVILSNELPKFNEPSGALAGRMDLLRLTQSWYGKEDPQLTGKLSKERPGILCWSIEGWRRLRERGHFVQPDSGRELLEELEALASPVQAFVAERCVLGVGYRTAFSDLYNAWVIWCAARGRQPGDDGVFGRDLLAAVPTLRRVRPRDGEKPGGRGTAYVGIGLRPL